MPSRGSYLLRIGGRLRSDVKAASSIVSDVQSFFNAKPLKALATWQDKPGAPWPDGLVLHDYHVCAWDFRTEMQGEQSHTVVSFRAEMHKIHDGTLYSNRESMVPDVRWFYESPEYRWYQEVKARLEQWNQAIGPENLIEHLWFRDWQWYCGNGGGT